MKLKFADFFYDIITYSLYIVRLPFVHLPFSLLRHWYRQFALLIQTAAAVAAVAAAAAAAAGVCQSSALDAPPPALTASPQRVGRGVTTSQAVASPDPVAGCVQGLKNLKCASKVLGFPKLAPKSVGFVNVNLFSSY